MKKIYTIINLLLIGLMLSLSGCSDYLDIIPDNVATIETLYSNRTNAEKSLFTCYGWLPNHNATFEYPGNVGGDDIWWNIDYKALRSKNGVYIAEGYQNASSPYENYWDGLNGGEALFTGIRDCNIFLENIGQTPDIQDKERDRWIAEVKFIKAYLHLFLCELYGPVPIIKENLSVEASPEEVRVFRDPVDDVIDYVVELIDEAMPDLPDYIIETATEQGRTDKCIAACVKAKALVWAASPLCNGNSDYANFVDNRGTQLISSTYDQSKWEKAAEAIKEAIDLCHESGHALYDASSLIGVAGFSDATKMKYSLRGCVTERPADNPEVIWTHTDGAGTPTEMQLACYPNFANYDDYTNVSRIGATLKVAEEYYTMNGVPIDEDRDWDYASRYEIQGMADLKDDYHKYYIAQNQSTAKLNYYREPRFYAHLGFDRGIFESLGQTEANSLYPRCFSGESQGLVYEAGHISTGYFIKKLISFRGSLTSRAASYGFYAYTMPLIRLADMYLLYAEALNEVKDQPDEDVYYWIDLVRNRAGLNGVVESWKQHSKIPNKPSDKEGMREIIKRERLIELSFEGERYFDLRRWKDAMDYLNEPVQGWNYESTTRNGYYTVTTYFEDRNFTVKDYLMPIYKTSLLKNNNLVQNPGW